MATWFSIPLIEGAQVMTVSLGGVMYSISLLWRGASVGAGWYVDFVPLSGAGGVKGVSLVFGVDLFKQFQHRNIGHLYARINGSSKNTPDYSDMGNQLQIVWSASDE